MDLNRQLFDELLRTMRALSSRDEVIQLMYSARGKQEYLEAGRLVLEEMEQAKTAKQHQAVLAETQKMHGQIQRLEHWGLGVAVFLGIFSMLEFFGCGPKSKSDSTPPQPPAHTQNGAFLDASKPDGPTQKGEQGPPTLQSIAPAEPAKMQEAQKQE